jgi:hypothetical protein
MMMRTTGFGSDGYVRKSYRIITNGGSLSVLFSYAILSGSDAAMVEGYRTLEENDSKQSVPGKDFGSWLH